MGKSGGTVARPGAQTAMFAASSRATQEKTSSRIASILVPLALLLGMTAGATTAQAAYPCSASTAGLILRTAGGTCASSLVLGQEFNLTYRVINLSIVDNPAGPEDETLVAALVHDGATVTSTLAQQESEPGAVELPGVLTFVPVCPLGSTGGALAPGDPCDPLNDQCGSRQCGCVNSPVGVGCHATADSNKVQLVATQNIPFAPGQQRTLATIRVKVTGLVSPQATCGLFYTRFDNGDFMVTDDPLCETQDSAGAQASADMSAPECQVDEDCGDPQCNECVDVGTNNHCAPRAANAACGVDAEPGDCLQPGCVIGTDNVGVCTQGVVDAPQDSACTVEDGQPVPTVECQIRQCNATGSCINVPDATQNDQACGTDEELTDCTTPACVNGSCTQNVLDVQSGATCSTNDGVPVPAVECQLPQCDASGTCVNVPDASQNGDACGTDEVLSDCTTPACVNGACNQGVIDLPAGQLCSTNNDVPVLTAECQVPQCDATGTCANVPDASQNGAACGTDQNLTDCKTPACLAGVCEQDQNNVPQDTPCAPDDNVCTDDVCDANGVCQHIGLGGLPCDDLLFCTGSPAGDVCVAGNCEGLPIDCGDSVACTEDTCSEELKQCLHTPSDALCADSNECTIDTCDVALGCLHGPSDALCDDDDPCTIDTCDIALGCVHEPDETCKAICRSPGYWATHSGTEKRRSINVAQLLIDKAGPLHVCGETITATSNALGSLSSDLEALCVRVQGVQQRQLYRQLMAAALNCAVSGIDCDTLTGDAFSQCNALCAGDPADSLTLGECVSLLDCFNNGGQTIDGKCALGTCAHDTDIACGNESGACPLYNGLPQACVPFENNCEHQPLCNTSIDFCPGDTPAGSSNACNVAKDNSCTIDSCD